MRSLLLRPVWIAGHLLALCGVVAFVLLGLWQLRRLDEVRATNALLAERAAMAPVGLGEALAAGPDTAAFRRVEVRGRYLPAATLVTGPRPQDGQVGTVLLTPLQVEDGTAVLVVRGWVPRDAVDDPATLGAAVPAPTGLVTVSGILVPAEEGADALTPDGLVRFIDPAALGDATPGGLAPLPLLRERQEPASALRPVPPPVRDEGNHGSYAVQWFTFALVVAVGYPLLLRFRLRERRGGVDGGRDAPRSSPART